ncbi:MAG: HEPN domain-containing protein [Chloroflexi bacterium]|nr:HEPN domain-containing protein [Chloroflexota bacterium]MBI3338547.1 HEPN domain-containing protein [Chloroflexota bacterium]
MTQDKSYKKDLIQYRLESAQEMLRDAQLLKKNGGSPVSVVNRAYYAVFYAALALLVTADVQPSKHSGVLAKFDELFVRQGILAKEMSRIIHHAFDMRQAGDYQKSRVITEEQAVGVLKSAEDFVKTIEKKLLQS